MEQLVKTLTVALLLMAYGTGCASYLVLEQSKKRVSYKRAVARGDEAAIKAINMGEGTVGVGIDVTNLEALKEQPLLQLGAAVLDALMIYGSYEGINSLGNNDKKQDDGNTITVTGDKNEINIIDGDNNDSNQDRKTEVAP